MKIVGAYNKTYGTDYDEEDVQHISRYVEKQYAIPINKTEVSNRRVENIY